MKNNYFSKVGWAIGFIVLFLIGFFIARNSGSEQNTFKRTQILLGTVVEIQVRNKDEKKAEDAIAKALAEVKRIDDLFTTYNEESPIWKINKSNETLFKVDNEIFNLLVLCDSVTKLSDGCFDVSLDNLTKAWGFYTDNPHLAAKTAIDSALSFSGWNNIELKENETIIRRNQVGFNFGAIAKGYAVDKAIEVLKKSGITNALVNAGGEIKVIGSDWKVGIQHPRDERGIIAVIKLNNNTVATSGDYEQFFEQNGNRYHHIIDPKTGYPAKGMQSVTIINESNTFADALATAVFVMGKEKGMKLIEGLDNTEAMIINDEGKIFYSSGFEKFLTN
ncbi:FAD:protein FMN transferase [Ignavibacterium sp.]|uniref:FAD:protein FMN transferase n=1 Tax=Ignavibacterium sp. TaxID=2651167 RepID=UPI00307EFE4D